ELISNASDAIDRLRLELLSRAELPEAEGPLQIRVSYDKDAGTITVTDNGIGMSRHEVIQNIGTIAKSGTREFLRSLTGDQRKDALLNGWRLRSIIEKYSDHISVPVLMPGEPENKAEEEEGTPKPDVNVNRASALWTRPKSELTDNDYNGFYQHIAGEFTDPLAWLHAKIEGIYEYTLLLFVPSSAPYDLWVTEARRGVRLHVQRVFIMED